MTDQKNKVAHPEEPLKRMHRDSILCEWDAPVRIFKRQGKEYFSTLLAVVFLFTLAFLFLKEFLLIGLVFTLAFFLYVLGTVKPEKVKNQLTKKGIINGRNFFRWEELTDFWTDKKHGHTIVHIIMPLRMPGRVILLLEKERESEILATLAEKLVYHEHPYKSWVDRAADWLAHRIHYENPEVAHK